MGQFTDWLETITGGASWRSIAEKLGTTHSTIQRRIKQDTATTVLEIAEAYGASRVEALLAAGALAAGDLDAYARSMGLNEYSDLELAQEMVRRIEKAQSEGSESDLATVTEFPQSKRPLPTEDRAESHSIYLDSDDDVQAALEEANQGRAVAQDRTEELVEPESP